jgi:predicted transglutaminase-like cysteine proteinase
MAEYNLLEKLFCGRPMNDGDVLRAALATASMDVTRAKAQVDAINQQLSVAKQQYASCAANSTSSAKALQAQITNLIAEKAQLAADLTKAQTTISTISSSLDGRNNFNMLPPATQAVLLQYYNKYPEAFVTYGGRTWGSGRSKYDLDVKAWLLEGQNDQAVNALLNECNGKISKVMKDNPDKTFHECCDIAVMRIKAKTDGMVQYAFDSQTWGSDEFWQFASETLAGKLGDCEDKAILNFVACRAAGIPREMLRIAAGMTFSDEGHCTNFYFASDLKFHHINSTTNYSASKDVKSLPQTGDSGEQLNLKNVWFSATDDKTFHWFTTEAKEGEDEGKKDGFLKWLKFNAKKKNKEVMQ